MYWRSVGLAVERGIIWLVFLQNIVDGSQHHPGDSNDGFLVPSTLFKRKVTASYFWICFASDGTIGTLYQKRLDVCTGSVNASSFLFTGTLVVLRSKPRPRAKLL